MANLRRAIYFGTMGWHHLKETIQLLRYSIWAGHRPQCVLMTRSTDRSCMWEGTAGPLTPESRPSTSFFWI